MKISKIGFRDPMNPFHTFHGDDVIPAAPEEALFHVIPVPLEKSVSYESGTADGPAAILAASCQLELFDTRSIPAQYGIHTAASVDCSGAVEEVLPRIAGAVALCLDCRKIPVVLGGEHTVTVGVAEALKQHYGRFGVIQFDAHADLRDSYQGAALSHACVMRRLYDKDIPFMQVGTRSYSFEEQQFRRHNKIPYVDAEEIGRHGVEHFALPADFPEQVYITIDIDAFDPSLLPATGTPVPGGLSWYQAMWLIEKVMESRICIGFDAVELAPIPTLHSSSFAAAQLVYNMMGSLTRSKLNRQYWQLPAENGE